MLKKGNMKIVLCQGNVSFSSMHGESIHFMPNSNYSIFLFPGSGRIELMGDLHVHLIQAGSEVHVVFLTGRRMVPLFVYKDFPERIKWLILLPMELLPGCQLELRLAQVNYG